MAASDNAALKESQELDPTLFCTAFNKNRFYMMTRREPFEWVANIDIVSAINWLKLQ